MKGGRGLVDIRAEVHGGVVELNVSEEERLRVGEREECTANGQRDSDEPSVGGDEPTVIGELLR